MKKMNKKWTCLLAVILTLTMLMSVCMVEAFAEVGVEPRVSGTNNGYNISALMHKAATHGDYYVVATCDVNMGIRANEGTIYYSYNGSGSYTRNTKASSDYYGYNVTISCPNKYASLSSAFRLLWGKIPTVFGYNGVEQVIEPYLYG